MNHRLRRARGFTLVEMLLATTLAGLLIGGVLTATAALSRDRRRMEAASSGEACEVGMALIRRDLATATALVGTPTAAAFEVIGYGGIDLRTRTPSQRLARVRYRLVNEVLVREQAYLDDAIRPEPWSEAVVTGVRRIELTRLSGDDVRVRLGEDVAIKLGDGAARDAARVPSRVRVRIERWDGPLDREMVLR